MTYITTDDIYATIQEPMLQSSIEKNSALLDTLEAGCLDEVRSYIGGRFDCTKIFGEPPIKNGMLVRIITCIVVYRAIRRNAARKVPENYEELNTWAYDALSRIRDGEMPLPGMPEIVNPETGEPMTFWGSNRKDEYFF